MSLTSNSLGDTMASSPCKTAASLLLALALLLQPLPPPAHAEGGISTADLTSGVTAADLVESLLADDSGIAIVGGSVSFSGANAAAGLFFDDEAIVGLEGGVILSTGAVASVAGPNLQDGVTTDHGLSGDQDLEGIALSTTFDAASLEFDFVPEGDSVAFIYVFSSDEYNEYANSEYNDAFGFFVNGVNYAQITTVGGEVVPVTINTINGGNPYGTDAQNPQYFRNNERVGAVAPLNTEMDGLTTVLSLQAPVNPNVPNHVKIVIADVIDGSLDSNVFIKRESFTDRAADLSLEMTTSAYAPGVGEDVTFTIRVTNAGPYVADIRARVDLPAGLTFSSATPEQGTYTPASGVWDLGAVAVDGSATLEIVTTAADGAEQAVTAQIV